MEQKKGIVDVDGVLADFASAVKLYSDEKLNKTIKLNTYSLSPPLTKEELNNLLKDEEFYSSILPYPDVDKYMSKIKSLGYYLIISSSRTVFEHITLQWLREHNIIYDIFIPRTQEGKVELIKEWGAEFIVEDHFGTAEQASRICKYSFLQDREYNRFINPRVRVVYSLDEVYNYLAGEND